MTITYQSPGIYQEEVFLRPTVPLSTGIPGFVGVVEAIASPDPIPSETLPSAIVELKRFEDFEYHFRPNPYGYLVQAVRGFFENGGDRCFIAPVTLGSTAVDASTLVQSLLEALDTLGLIDEIDLVAMPDAAFRLINRRPNTHPTAPLLSTSDIQRLQRALIQHCHTYPDRFAVVDALPSDAPATAADEAMAQRQAITSDYLPTDPVNAALYYPWVVTEAGEIVPPCGHVAGIMARSDRTRGVFKAPANALVKDVQDLQSLVTVPIQNQLNPDGINCFRAFPGRGIRLWGARTLSRDSTWRYISARRLVLTIERWIERNMAWATFEPNSPQLWIRIQRELTAYLTQLWRSGALLGPSASDAFFVKCDAETNPPERRELGQVQTHVGLAIAAPAEFLIIRVTQRPNETEIT